MSGGVKQGWGEETPHRQHDLSQRRQLGGTASTDSDHPRRRKRRFVRRRTKHVRQINFYFLAFCVNIAKTVEDTSKVTIND